MKIKNIFFLFLILMAIAHTQQTAPSNPTPTSKQPVANNNSTDAQLKEAQEETSTIAFFDMPTYSIYQDLIDEIYGQTGLNISNEIIEKIKKTYCYFEFLIKKNKVEYDKNFAKYQDDFKEFLQSSQDNILRKPTQALVESNAWKSIELTQQDFIDSDQWQIFIKSMICDSFDANSKFLIDSMQINNQMFVNLANIEMAYPTTNFTQLRLLQESIQLETLIQNQQQERYIIQCLDWKKNLPKDMIKSINQFKKTEFYTYSHLPQPTTQTSTVIPNTITEQILLYVMLIDIQSTINDLVLLENTSNFLNKASSKKLVPNFFNYVPSDLIFLQDLLILQKLSDAVKISPPSTISMQETPEGGVQENAKQKKPTIFKDPSLPKADTGSIPEQVAEIIFTIVPTTSINEKNFDEIYGSKGLNIPEDLLNNIKQAYCYLEFLIKIDKVKNDKDFAQYRADFKGFLEPREDGAPVMPTDLLVKSKGWNAVTITNDDIINSAIWQIYIKTMICDIFDSQATFIINNAQTNNQLFSYLPNIETTYSTNDFIDLRLYGESMQTQLQLGNSQLQKYILQCNDWKSIDITKIADAIAIFKKTDFYKYSHSATITNKQDSTKKSSSEKSSTMPFFIEQLTLNFLLLNIQTSIFQLLNTDNLMPFLKQANSKKNLANFFTYSQNDFIYIHDFLTITNITKQNKISPNKSIVVIEGGLESEENDDQIDDQNVTVQSFGSVFKSISKSSSKVLDPTKNGVSKSVAKTNRDSNKALDPAQNGFNKKITNPSKKVFDRGMKEFNFGIEKMCLGVTIAANALTTGLIETMVGTAFVTCSLLELMGAPIDAKRQAGILRQNMEEERGTLNAVFSGIILHTASCMFPFIALYMVTMDQELTMGAFNTVVMEPLMFVFEFLDMITNACTTAFIESTYWQVYACYVIANAFGGNYNPKQEANNVKAVLEKHRSTINIVMGIVISIASTILFMGLSAGATFLYESAAMAGYLGAGTMARVGAQIAARETAKVAAKKAALALAKEATEAAAREAAEAAAEATFKEAAEIAAKETLENTVEVTAIKAAQIALKNASQASVKASATAQKLLANATLKKAEQVAAEKALSSAILSSTQANLVAGASKSVLTANEKVVAKKLAETSAKESLEKAIASGADDVIQAPLKRSLATATTERQTAELSAQGAKEFALKQSSNFTKIQAQQTADAVAAQAALKASTQAGSKSTSQVAGIGDDVVNPMFANQTITKSTASSTQITVSTSSKTAAQSSSKTAAQSSSKTAAQNLATKEAEQKAAQIALKDSQETLLQAQAVAAKNSSNAFAQAAVKGASKQVAQKQVLANTADDALAIAAKDAAEESAQNATKIAAQEASEEATKNAAKIATEHAQSTLGKQSIALAEKQAAKTNAEIALKNAQSNADDLARMAADDPGVLIKQMAERAALDVTEKQTALKLASKELAEESAQNATKIAAQEASEEATKNAAKIATEHAQSTLGKQSIALAEKQAAKTNAEIALKNAQSNADDLARMAADDPLAKEMAERAALDLAEKQTTLKLASKEVDEVAEGILKSRKDAFNAMSTYSGQRIREQGLFTVMKDWSFIIGQVFNIGFGVFSVLGAIHEDELAAQAAKEEEESIQALWRFVEDNKVSSVQNQNLFMDELHKKHQAAIANQTFGLQYYSNFLNSSINMVQNQISQALAQQQIQLLTPDSNGMRIADIGSLWGLQTPFTYLYPSQGFISTTLGRPDFPYAQEVAQAPLASETHGDKKIDFSDNQPAATKLWFKQRAISTLNQPVDQPLNVEIRFRILYNLDTAYHIGLYLGGTYHDYESAAYLQSIEDKNSIDLAEAHLAKMFVLKRSDAKSTPSVGLYENEGKGWIVQHPVDAKTLNTANIYHMKAQLNKNQLTIGFWSEANPSEKWTQTVTVTACDQRTFGVIFSGAAIEWGIVQPTQPIIQNKTARIASNGQSEADRERASKAKWKQIMNPKFGSLIMQSFGRPAILQGQYVYTTQSTGLVDGQGKAQTDYMIFATATGNVVTNLGANPAPSDGSVTPNAAISLITGNAYNSSGKIITNVQNALDTYALNSNAISQSLGEAIAQAGKYYQQQLLNFTFGNYQLTALSQNAIDAGLFIYTCPTSTATKDSFGKPILDYLIMADIVNGSLGSTVGMPPSSIVKGMISLITGNVYDKTSPEPIDSGYSPLAQYTKQYGQLPQDIADAINNAAEAYNNSVNAQTTTKETTINLVASQTMSFTDLMNALPPSTGGFEFGLSSAAPSNIIATKSTISQLQTVAAGGATVEFSGMGAVGFGFGDVSSSSRNISTPQTHSMNNENTGGANLGGQTYEMPTDDQTIDANYTNQDISNNFDDTTAINEYGDYDYGDYGYGDYGYGFDDIQDYNAPIQQGPIVNNIASTEQNIPVEPTPTETINYNNFELAGSSGFSF